MWPWFRLYVYYESLGYMKTRRGMTIKKAGSITKLVNGNFSGTSTFVYCFQVELESEMLGFVQGGKPEYPEKNPRSRDENQQQTQPTNGVNSVNRIRETLV